MVRGFTKNVYCKPDIIVVVFVVGNGGYRRHCVSTRADIGIPVVRARKSSQRTRYQCCTDRWQWIRIWMATLRHLGFKSPAQSVLSAHLMRFCLSHEYVLGDLSLTRSEESLGLQSSQYLKACFADPTNTIFSLHFFTHVVASCILEIHSRFSLLIIWVIFNLSSSSGIHWHSTCTCFGTQPTCLTDFYAQLEWGSRAHL